MTRKHWDAIYSARGDEQLSWTQQDPAVSLELIRQALPAGGSVLDVGGGTSRLVDRLLEAGYAPAVLDISPAALDRARGRLGERANAVRWIVADVTARATGRPQADPCPNSPHSPTAGTGLASPDPWHGSAPGPFDLWHDRAVFHFLTDPTDRAAYIALLKRTLRPGGHALIATFDLAGPDQCSGLPVVRYSPATLAAELGADFSQITTRRELHRTPWGAEQAFQYSLFRRG